ncbi:MAG: hypothetical protein IJ583_03340 [Firmicutes bacterium]|nr:hypothetical protein [Bacillota bacterium]
MKKYTEPEINIITFISEEILANTSMTPQDARLVDWTDNALTASDWNAQ